MPNNSPATHKETKPRRRLRDSHLLLIALGVLIGGYVLWLVILDVTVDWELEAIRERGYPATAEELDAWYPSVPEDENAALVLREAFNRIHKPPDKQIRENLPRIVRGGEAKMPANTEPLPEEMQAAITQHLTEHEKALKLLHEGAAMELSRYSVDLSRGFGVDLPHLESLGSGANLLILETLRAAEDERGGDVARSIRAILGLGDSLEHEPTLVSQFTRLSIYSRGSKALERTLNRTTIGDDPMAELIADLEEAETPPAMTKGYVGKRAVESDLFAGSSGPMSRRKGRLTLLFFRVFGLPQLNRLTALELMRDHVEASKLPMPERGVEYKRLERASNDLPFYAFLAELGLSDLSQHGILELRHIAELRTARLALAIERFRMANDHLPETLDALTPKFIDALPADPFAGDLLKYKRLDTGYTAYSVGEDKKDNSGARTNSADEEYELGADIPFTVGR